MIRTGDVLTLPFDLGQSSGDRQRKIKLVSTLQGGFTYEEFIEKNDLSELVEGQNNENSD